MAGQIDAEAWKNRDAISERTRPRASPSRVPGEEPSAVVAPAPAPPSREEAEARSGPGARRRGARGRGARGGSRARVEAGREARPRSSIRWPLSPSPSSSRSPKPEPEPVKPGPQAEEGRPGPRLQGPSRAQAQAEAKAQPRYPARGVARSPRRTRTRTRRRRGTQKPRKAPSKKAAAAAVCCQQARGRPRRPPPARLTPPTIRHFAGPRDGAAETPLRRAGGIVARNPLSLPASSPLGATRFMRCVRRGEDTAPPAAAAPDLQYCPLRYAQDEDPFGAKKRFKVTGSGKVRARHAMTSHILEKKSAKRKRKLAGALLLPALAAETKRAKKLLGAKTK